MEGNIASVHLEECVSGFCLQRGVECGFKWRKGEREEGGSEKSVGGEKGELLGAGRKRKKEEKTWVRKKE